MKRDVRVCINVDPGGDWEAFRVGAADDILQLLVDAHDEEFTVPELVDATGAARSTVWRGIDLLDDLDVVCVRETPQRNYVSIDPEHLQKDDPVLAIEQSEFHEPVRAFRSELREEISQTDDVTRLVGVVVFGSVARGDADRRSDIDLFVVVEGDRTAARRCATAVASRVRDRRFGGERYDVEPYVESVTSATRAGGKLREILDEGITIYRDDGFDELRRRVIGDE